MIKKMKKLISLLLMLSMTCSLICLPANAEVYINEVKYDEAFTALGNLGFITYTEGDIQVDQKMTRIEFVRLLSKLYGDAFVAHTTNAFTDVYADSDDAKLLDAAYSMNIVSGYGGEFRPDDIITFRDAVVMCVKAIGYHVLDGHLTYSTDYVSIADDADLLDNIANRGDNFSRADAYMLVYNTMKADMFVQVSYGRDAKYARKEGKTLLGEYHDVFYIEGQVTKTNVTGLVSNNPYEYGIEITDKDGMSVQARCGMEYNDLIGMNVNALYRDDEKGNVELISCVLDEKRLEIIEIAGDALVSVNADRRELRYEQFKYDSQGKKTSIREKKEIIPITANWIYNGQYVSNVKRDVLEKLDAALKFTTDLNIDKIKLIDLDGDSEFELVKVDMYRVLVLDHVGSTGITVDTSSQNPHSPLQGEGFIERSSLLMNSVVADYNNNFDLDLTEDKTYYIHSQDEEELDITNLNKFTVLSVKEGLGTKPYVEVCATEEKVRGKLVSKESDYTIIFEDGNEYTVANVPNLSSAFDTLTFGKDYEFFLDICGRVAGWVANKEGESEMQLGFVLRSKYLSDEMVNYVSIYNPKDGKDGYDGVQKLYTAERVIIDGSRMPKGHSIAGLEGELIRYQLNDEGEIRMIETPDGTPKDGKLQYFVKDPAVRQNTRNNFLYFKFAINIFVNQDYMAGSLAMDKDTVILRVPDDISDTEQWKYCTQMRYEEFTRDTTYNDLPIVADGYVYDSDSVVCDIIVIRSSPSFISVRELNQCEPMVIDKIKTSWSEESGSTVLTLRGADSSGTRNYYCLDENINVIDGYAGSSYTYRAKPASAIHKGDVVLPYCDTLGRLVAVLIMYSYSGETSYGDPTMLLTANGDRSSACFVGTVQKIEEPFMLFKEKNSQENWVMSIRRDSGAKVVIYDTENQEARPGTYLDLMSSRGEVLVKAFNSRVVTQIVVFI